MGLEVNSYLEHKTNIWWAIREESSMVRYTMHHGCL